MNKTHRSIWNAALGAWVAVAESTQARGKRSSGGDQQTIAPTAALPAATASGDCGSGPVWLLASLCITGSTLLGAQAWARPIVIFQKKIVTRNSADLRAFTRDKDFCFTNTMVLKDGGKAVNRQGAIDVNRASKRAVTVTGNDSTWTNSARLSVGYNETGRLNVMNGGMVSNTMGVLGAQPQSRGDAKVSGAGSSWTHSEQLVIGEYGTGTLTLSKQGCVSVENGRGLIFIAAGKGSIGVLNIGAADGRPAQPAGNVEASELEFGEGQGSLNFNHTDENYKFPADISGAAQLNHSAGRTTLTGTNSYTGGTLVKGGVLQGNTSSLQGDIDIHDQAKVVFDQTTEGSYAGIMHGGGALKKEGAGTLILTGRNRYCGGTKVIHGVLQGDTRSLQGNIDINPPLLADLNTPWPANIDRQPTVIFAQAEDGNYSGIIDSKGVLIKEGEGTLTLTNNGSFSVHTQINRGTLNIANAVQLENYYGYIGDKPGSSGKVTVSGPGSGWKNFNELIVGHHGNGTLQLLAGGKVSSHLGVIGAVAGSTSHVTVSGPGSSWMNSDELHVGYQGNGSLTIVNRGKVSVENSVDKIFVASENGSTGVLNIGAAVGRAAQPAGSLEASALIFGEGNGRLNFNHNDTDYVFATRIEGPGSVQQIAGTTLLTGVNSYSGGTALASGRLVGSASSFGRGAIAIEQPASLEIAQASDATLANDLRGNGVLLKSGSGALNYTGNGSDFSGTTQIISGSLSVNSQLGGTLLMGQGARLQGAGTVGSTQLHAASVLAPGNSVRTLKVAGDLTFAPGSYYEVEVDADGHSGLVQVTGHARLTGGTAKVLAGNGNWSELTQFTILTADAGVTGAFDAVSSNLAFLTPSLDYSAKAVTLSLKRNATSFAEVGATTNQQAVGAGAQTVAAGALYTSLVHLDVATARSAFDQLSGQIHASLRTALVEDSRLVREAAIDRLRLAQGGVAVNSGQLGQAGDGGAAWARAYDAWGEYGSDGNAAQIDRSVRGLLVGADQAVGDWRLGAFAGSGRSKLNTRNSSASVHSVHLGLYGGRQWGTLGLRTGLAYAKHHIDTARKVEFTGLADSAQATYQSQSSQVFGELGWQLGAGLTSLEPFANLAYTQLHTDGFKERAGISALQVRPQRRGTTFATLGMRASTQWLLGSSQMTARGVLGWRHAFGDVRSSASMALAGGAQFAVTAVPVARDAAVLELGLDTALQRDLTLGLAYSGQIGHHFREHAVKANLLWKF